MPISKWWQVSFWIGLALLIMPLWMASYPPLIDLPQHAAQVTIGRGWLDGDPLYRQTYEHNPLAIQVLAYGLVFLLAFLVPVVVAFKLVLSMALVATSLSILALLRETKGDPWWIFLVFPALYGFSLFWGFVAFVVATPLGLGLILVGVRYSARPTTARLVWLAVLPLGLFFAHVLVLGWAGLIAALLVTVRANDPGSRWRGLGALGTAIPLVASWLAWNAAQTPNTTALPVPHDAGPGIGARLMELLALQAGREDPLSAWWAGTILLALPFAMGARASRKAWRWVPFGVTMAIYLTAPAHAFGTAYLYHRGSFFVLPTLLVALDPAPKARRALRGVAVPFAFAWLTWISAQFRAFDEESRPVVDLLATVEPGGRLLSLADSPRSRAAPWYPYLHFGTWYQVERRGIVDFSFAEYFPNRFRYRPDHDPPLPPFLDWDPTRFDWNLYGGDRYDYFLVRRTAKHTWDPFAGATSEIELLERRGTWSLFRQNRASIPIEPSSEEPSQARR